MYKVYFDNDDSFIYEGETFYFHKKENINPFIRQSLFQVSEEVWREELGFDSVKEFVEDCFDKNGNYKHCYIHQIKAIDE